MIEVKIFNLVCFLLKTDLAFSFSFCYNEINGGDTVENFEFWFV